MLKSIGLIIGDISLRKFIPPRWMFLNCHKVMCSCGICISTSMIQSELNAWRSRNVEKLRSVSEISHLWRSIQEREQLYDYINGVYPNGSH